MPSFYDTHAHLDSPDFQAAFPQKRFLVLTHNKPLMLDLRDRYKRLTGEMPKTI